MDDNLRVALTAVPHTDHGAAAQWFRLLCETDAQPAETWDAYVAALKERAPAAGVDPSMASGFGAYVGASVSDPMACVRALVAYGDTLPDWYFAAAAPEPAGYDESAWHAFLAENGPRWAGTDETWPGWREWFAYTAAERGLNEPATAFLAWLDTQPDRIAAFATYNVVITPPAGAPAGDDAIDRALAELADFARVFADEEVPNAQS